MERNIGIKPKKNKGQEDRVALIIGNANYKHTPLRNPINDAEDISKKLHKLQFKVMLHLDANIEMMRKAIEEFYDKLSSGGIALFYYAGHGMQVKNKNFLMPVGSEITKEYQMPHRAIDLGEVLGAMEGARSKMNMVFLDACRNNPFARSFRSASRGLAQINAPDGSLIVYATSPGRVAIDGEGRNGVFTEHLLKYIDKPNLEISAMLKRVRKSVKRDTNNEQVPWESSCIDDDFYFNILQQTNEEMIVERVSEPVDKKPKVVKANEIAGFEYAGTREYTVGGVSNKVDEYVHDKTGMEFVKIPAGKFMMGSDRENKHCKPVHEVSMEEYLLSKYVVTQNVWKNVMKNEQWKQEVYVEEGDKYPAVYVSWKDAIVFCEKIGLSLPSEAQWEYGCRGGTTSKYYWGEEIDRDYLWFNENARNERKVGLKKANGYGLYDMLGNVWEWCEDEGNGNYKGAPVNGSAWGDKSLGVSIRVIRGGSFRNSFGICSSARRVGRASSNRCRSLGFRVCRPGPLGT